MNHALIIGGGGGLGRALVQVLLEQKWNVSVAGRTDPQEPALQRFYPLDAAAVDWAAFLSHHATFDAIIFVAGTAAFGKTEAVPVEEAKRIFDLNFWSLSQAAASAGTAWRKAGRAGKFLAVLSIAGKRAVPWESYYAASKAAAARFLECLQLEYADEPIEFLPAYPGLLRTPFRDSVRWFGMAAPRQDGGADVRKTAEVLFRMLTGRRRQRVIGWRERAIDWADRIWPGLYDRLVLRKRIRSQS